MRIIVPRAEIYFSRSLFLRSVLFLLHLTGRDSYLEKFRQALREFCGVKHVILTSSGRISLYLILRALGVGVGDEVILSAYNVPEVPGVIKLLGAVPVFVDIDSNTMNMDYRCVESVKTPNSKVLLVTHLYGRVCELDKLYEIAGRNDLRVVEDTAQALGAKFKGEPVARRALASYYSFGILKNLNTLEGGAICTNDDGVMEKINKELEDFKKPSSSRLLKLYIKNLIFWLATNRVVFSYGVYPILYFLNIFSPELVYNLGSSGLDKRTLERLKYRFSDFQAFLGVEQLKRINRDNYRRRKNAILLSERLKNKNWKKAFEEQDTEDTYLNYVITSPSRDLMIKRLFRLGIDAAHGYLKNCSNSLKFFPNSQYLEENNIYLPIHPHIRQDEIEEIARVINSIVE